MPAEFEQDVVHKTQCEVHIFDPTLSLGTQQQLRLVKEFHFHDTGRAAESNEVDAGFHFVNILPGHTSSCGSNQHAEAEEREGFHETTPYRCSGVLLRLFEASMEKTRLEQKCF